MTKVLTIKIKPVTEAMETFRKSFRTLARTGGARPRPRQRDEVFFSVGERGRGRAGRNRKAPRAMFDQIALKIAI